MKKDWTYLGKLIGDRRITVSRIRLDDEAVAIEGEFELPPLARLSPEDQVFVALFVKSHGSIKRMERHFGISYPTVKNRLNRIGAQLGFVEVTESADQSNDVLSRLERGEIDVETAIAELRKRSES